MQNIQCTTFILRFVWSHRGRVMHICVSKLVTIGQDNGLSPGRRQYSIWTDSVILLNGPFGTKFSDILIAVYTFSVKKMHFNCHLEMAASLSGPQWVNVLCGGMATTDSEPQRCCIDMGTIMYLLLIPTKYGFLLPKHLIPSSNYDLSFIKYHFRCDATVKMKKTPDLKIIVVIISQ